MKGPTPSKRYRQKVEAGDWYLVPGDIHHDKQDQPAVTAMMEWWDKKTWMRRRGVVPQGDSLDLWGLSRYPKSAKKIWTDSQLMKEADAARPFLEWASAQPLGCKMILGNHEKRLEAVLDENPSLHGCPGVEFGAMTGLDDIEGLEILDWNSQVWLGDKCCIRHGDAPGFPKTCSAVCKKYPDQVTLFGHTHRLGAEFVTVYGDDGLPQVRGAYNVGHLSLLPEYYDDPDWHLGFAEIEFFGDRGNGQPFFRVGLHHIFRDSKGNCHVA